MMNPAYYRVRLLVDLFQSIGMPVLALSNVLSFFQYRLGLLAIPSYLGIVLFWAVLRGAYTEHKKKQEAKALGARPIPRVIGKWPGNIDILLKMMRAFKTSYVLDVYLQLFEEYQCTTLNTRILWRDTIISMDQQHAKYVLATGFQNFWRGKAQKERMETFLGEGIFNRDDETWKMHRNIARPFLARERFLDFEIFEKFTSSTMLLLSSLEASNTPFDAQDIFSRFTIDAASEFLFGKNLDTLSGSLPIAGQTKMGPKGSATEDTWGSFAYAFEMAQVNITIRARLGSIWPLFELIKDRNKDACDVIRKWIDPLVQQALNDKRQMQEAGIEHKIEEKTFMQHLAETTNDPITIRDQLLNMLLASRDTTACVLTYILYFMAIRPDITARMRTEVFENCGPTAAPTSEDFKQMKFMRAVINEAMRLFPPVPLNVREAREHPVVLPLSDGTYNHQDSVNAQPLYIPARTTIMYFPLLIQRNPALWGEDADEFDPERWIDPARLGKYLANPTIFTPFSAGPRICLGQNYAYNQMSYFLVRLLQQFDRVTLEKEYQPEGSMPPPEWKSRNGRQAVEQIWPAAAMTLYVKGGLWVRLHRAK